MFFAKTTKVVTRACRTWLKIQLEKLEAKFSDVALCRLYSLYIASSFFLRCQEFSIIQTFFTGQTLFFYMQDSSVTSHYADYQSSVNRKLNNCFVWSTLVSFGSIKWHDSRLEYLLKFYRISPNLSMMPLEYINIFFIFCFVYSPD